MPLGSPPYSAYVGQFGPKKATPIVPLTVPDGATAVYALFKAGGYDGSCLRVVRASDSAEQDIGFNAAGFLDIAAAKSFMGASSLSIKTWYDQSGNGNDATQATAGNRPLLNTELTLYGFYSLFFGDITDIFAGTKRYFDLPATLDFDANSVTALSLVSTSASGNIHPIFQVGPDAGSIFLSMFNRNTAMRPAMFLASTGGFPVTAPVPGPLSSGFAFTGLRSGATNKSIFGTEHKADGGVYTSNSAAASGTGTGGHIGFSSGASACFRGDMYALVIYPSVLSDADVFSVRDEFARVWNPASTAKDRVLIYDGDSITEGYGATYQRNRTRLTLESLNTKSIDYYNMAISGRTADGNNQTKIQALSYQTDEQTAGSAVVLLTGINDIRAEVSGSDIWTNYIDPYLTYAVGLGYNVAVGTLIRNDNLTTAEETERQALNTLIRDNAPGLGCTVIDYDADSETITLVDGTHPDDAGYAVMSARELPTIRTMLGLS